MQPGKLTVVCLLFENNLGNATLQKDASHKFHEKYRVVPGAAPIASTTSDITTTLLLANPTQNIVGHDNNRTVFHYGGRGPARPRRPGHVRGRCRPAICPALPNSDGESSPGRTAAYNIRAVEKKFAAIEIQYFTCPFLPDACA
ncbi:hypothetical protein EVAR_86419_1 [Eumeta japonica]|uniref:Uncharacterized protein n=1 Tax=Eumeta variegata TaxID=151549 RepID=A0A4C1ZB72_EUMVA|nr:hypothetical protein EVAR_86419_1 [Eumeta japonica]